MIFNLNKNDRLHLEKLLETNETNYSVSEMYQYYFYNLARSISNKDVKALMKLNNLKEKDAFFYCLMSKLEIDISDKESLDMAKSYIYQGLSKLDISTYTNNPYLKNIKFDKSKNQNIKIEYDEYLPFEGFPSNDIVIDEDNYYQEQYQLGYFNDKFTFQSITHDNITWMSIIPNEIETMKDDINKVKGNVLVYGLGLGYFAYMISNKKDVNSLTIVEKDSNIIKLFKNIILPQFAHKEKITIVNDDAFHFEKTNTKQYDYAYVDLYHGGEDGTEIYVKFKQLELRSKNYLYWLEKTLINVIRRNLITIIYEQYHQVDCQYDNAKNFNDKLINALYKKIQNKTFSSYDEIHHLLKEESIKNLVKEIKII